MSNIVDDDGKPRPNTPEGQKHSTSSTVGEHNAPPRDNAHNSTVPNIVAKGATYPGETLDGTTQLGASCEGPPNTPPSDNPIVGNTVLPNTDSRQSPRTPVAPYSEKHPTTSTTGVHNTPQDAIAGNPAELNINDMGKNYASETSDRRGHSASSIVAVHEMSSVNTIADNPEGLNIIDDGEHGAPVMPRGQKDSTSSTADAQNTTLPTWSQKSDIGNKLRVRLHFWFKSFRETWVPIINLGIGVLALLVIAFQAKIYIDQIDIMNQQSKFMQISERAYVGVSDVKFHSLTRTIEISLQNIGHVPAKAIKLHAQDHRFIEGTDRKSKGAIFPWDAGNVDFFPGTPMLVVIPLEDFEEGEVDAISTKKETLYIRGTIHYDDGFGNRDKTNFAFQYLPEPINRWVAHSDLSKRLKEDY